MTSWAIVATVTTRFNTDTYSSGRAGWGYIHPPVNVVKQTGVTPNLRDTATMYACLPNNFDQYTDLNRGTYLDITIWTNGSADVLGVGANT